MENSTKSFHHLQNTNFLNRSFLTGYDERHHYNKVEIEEPSMDVIIENHLQYELLQVLLHSENLYLFEKYTYNTIATYNITNGGLYDDWNCIF